MQCHEIDYKIIDHGIQMAEIALDPGESVFLTHFTNSGQQKHHEAFAAAMSTQVDIAFHRRLGTGFRWRGFYSATPAR